MKKIILNADDFGRHIKINEAVKKAVETGALRSATLMTTGAAFGDAVKVAKSAPTLGVGLHLTLVDDTPLSPKENIPTLTDKDGKFYPDYMSFLKAYFMGKISREDIKTELSAQFAKIERSGLKITHIDSHQHLHHAPGVLEIAVELAKKANVYKMRISHTPLFSGESTNIKQLIGRFGLFSLSTYAKFTAKKHNFKSPDNFAGIVAGEAVSEDFLINEIQNLKEGATEVMMHPATDNAAITAVAGWKHDFITEYKAASSEKVLNLLKEKDIEVINYNNI